MTRLHETLLSSLQQSPAAPAIDDAKYGVVTYGALLDAVSRLVKTVKPARSIGILSTRSPEAYVAVVACFLAGRKYIPLNPSFPVDRLRRISDLANVDLIAFGADHAAAADSFGLSSFNVTDLLIQSMRGPQAGARLDDISWPDPEDIAYHLFTSGSTGDPKGVPISYASLSAYVTSISEYFSFPAAARYSQVFDLSFDISMHDIFVALTHGGTLVPASDMNLLMPHSYIEKRSIDVWFSVPTLAVPAIRGFGVGRTSHRLKLCLFAGEPLPMDCVRGFRGLLENGASIYNLYGPTEATVTVTAHRVTEADDRFAIAPIGVAFGMNRLGILKGGQVIEQIEEADEGELLLGGPQVFDGYQPPCNAEALIAGESGRFYRSGDLVKFENGVFHHLGRLDDQVQVRGHRIELGEIEAAFRKSEGLGNVAAVVLGRSDTARLGLAYDGDADSAELAAAASQLPPYMVPQSYLRVATLPLNVNGKIDRRALAESEWPDH